ncbi:SGNH/GDSL hydrolase family protein [Klebsiella pneumoniae]|uniref:SGNH/GDSL hydrolase family protein n=1 Tax=Klebsiella pneumoniae TaxID=573 RepID=UPI002150BCAC|nr:SGNH/GDSL hydrolase family protein [Klebsiella pneumoniae]MDA5131668.1 SGNH/GDSL hydrolase family protein [Klebsiella pneumoniae]MDA5191999.1 SGNH/GDSL hydrolase family protein [Klebsiella pneumoniae]HCJ2819328.1 SGNH/GDSL hydrolase family protein [Klebsiella pneumoniae]
MFKWIIFVFCLLSFSAESKTLFFGDSLTYVIGNAYKKHNNDTDVVYNVGFSFISNHEYMFNYIDNSNLNKYDKLFIVFGTNDFIHSGDVDNYSVLSILFISRILHHNKNIEITWILPPIVKNDRKNELIQHTKTAIKKGMKPIGIRTIDPDIVFGGDYREKVDNKAIRTADGVHITNYGADLIVDLIRD